MEERGLVGLEARAGDGSDVVGRISEVITDEETGEVTHVLVTHVVEANDNRFEEQLEVPITSLDLDPEADFATFHSDPSDEEPGDHVDDDERPAGYAPNRDVGPEDYPHDGQFVTTPTDPDEANPEEDAVRESGEAGAWQDEDSTTVDSGYPRNDAYIDPDSGLERERYPEGEDLRGDVEELLVGTELRVRDIIEGIIGLEGVAEQVDLDDLIAQILELDGVLDVDATDVQTG